MESIVQRFLSLFDGNRSAVGLEEGGCKRLADTADWELEVEGHLRYDDCAVGVYPMVRFPSYPGSYWAVKWGCVDFDEGDEESWVHAVNVRAVLGTLDVAAYIERSRSKGYHVWVFAHDWVPAQMMRQALLAACQIAAAPMKEINPKQVELQPDQLGNYVRLPYPAALTGPIYPGDDGLHRRVVLRTDGTAWSLQAFLSAVQKVNEDQLELVASYYMPPRRELPDRDWSTLTGSAVDRLRGKAKIIFEQGPLEHPDSPTGFRGHTLWKLACLLAEDGHHTPEEALELLVDADQRWGKFSSRPDGMLRLEQMIHRAFSGGTDAARIHGGGQA